MERHLTRYAVSAPHVTYMFLTCVTDVFFTLAMYQEQTFLQKYS